MNILIIGGTRLMGPYVVRELTRWKHAVTLFHRGETEADLPASVQHINGDRSNLPDYSDQLLEVKPEIVLDMMLRTEKEASDLMDLFEGVVRRVVIASSMDVYKNYGLLLKKESGEGEPDRLTEDAPLRNKLYPYRHDAENDSDWRYWYDKIPIEKTVMSRPGLTGTVLRLPMVYGPCDYQHRLYPYLKRMQDQRSAIILHSRQLEARLTRGYVANIAAAIALAVLNNQAAGRVYNAGEPKALIELEWIRRIGKIMQWTGDIVGLTDDRLPDHLKADVDWRHHLDVDSSRIRRELDYSEEISHDEGLRRTIEWELANPPANVTPEQYDYDAEDVALNGQID